MTGRLERTFWIFGVPVAIVYALAPVAWIVSLSLKPAADIGDGRFFPRTISFENYAAVFRDPQFPAALRNSLADSTRSAAPSVAPPVPEPSW